MTRTFGLHGYERFFAMNPATSAKLAHVATVTGDIETLLAHLHSAVQATFNLHPKMRALLLPGVSPQQVMICSPITVHAELKPIVSILHRENEAASDEWVEYVQQECEKPLNRERAFPYYLHVLVDSTTKSFARMILFSDHYMADTVSGQIVLHTILSSASKLTASPDAQTTRSVVEPEELPLQPSLYECEHSVNPWLGVVSEAVSKWVVEPYFQYDHASFSPVLPLRADQQDYASQPPSPQNPSYALFARGTEANMAKALTRCQEEDVSLQGVLIIATALAFGMTKHDALCYVPTLQLKMDVVCDRRSSVEQAKESASSQELVGLYTNSGSLVYTATEGIDVADMSFWECVRHAERQYQCAMGSHETKLQTMYVHESLNAESLESTLHVAKSTLSDTTVSNVVLYPYESTYAFGGSQSVNIDSMHLYNALPSLSAASMMFLSGVKEFNYSMMHKVEEAEAKVLFDWYVRCMENLGNVGKEDTLLDVSQRLAQGAAEHTGSL